MVKPLKKHLDIKQQVEKLKSRGLLIEDEEYANSVLERVNYYRLTGYLHDFKEAGKDTYKKGTSFNQIVEIYEFDRKLNRILMFALENIEETFKTRFAYALSSSYPNDPMIYRRKSIYRDAEELSRSRRMMDQAKKNNKNLPFVKHHIEEYGGRLPVWVAVEIMTMGTIRALYCNLQGTLQKTIAKAYNTGPMQLKNWVENITFTRNHLAHYMRIYNYYFGRIPASCKNHYMDVVYKGQIFDQIAVMSFMYSDKDEWNSYVIPRIKELIDMYAGSVELAGLGFPEDWEQKLRI